MATKEEIKEIAVQLTNVVIANAADEDLTGEEKEHKVIEFLVKLDDNLPIANFIPNVLEAQIIEAGVDNVQAYFKDHSPIDFVKKCYQRIKHLIKK